MRCSSATAAPSIQPCSAAALIIAYSPRHVVRRDRHVDLGAHGGDDVEVGERRLHHHHVGAFGDVEARPRRAPRGRCASPAGSPCDRHRRRCARRPRRGTGRTAPTRTWPRRPGSQCRRSPRRRARRGWRRTWPSIIPLGATTSAPAVGLGDGDLAYSSRVASLSTSPVGREHAAVAVVGVLVEAQVGHEDDAVADLVAQVARARAARCRRRSHAWLPVASLCAGTPNRIDRGDAEIRELAYLFAQTTHACAGRRRAAKRSAAARRCPPGRTAGRRGRRPAAASPRPAGGARECAATGEDGERGRSPSNPTAGGHQRAPRPSPGSCAPRAPRSLRSPHRRPRQQ